MNYQEFLEIIEAEGDYKEGYYRNIKWEIWRSDVGAALCGYCHFPKKCFHYSAKLEELDVQVHGGITYAKKIYDIIVVGFDCMHATDFYALGDDVELFKEINERRLTKRGLTYRTMDYVQSECESVIDQVLLKHESLTI